MARNSPGVLDKISSFGGTQTATKCPSGYQKDRNVNVIRMKHTKLTYPWFAEAYSANIVLWQLGCYKKFGIPRVNIIIIL